MGVSDTSAVEGFSPADQDFPHVIVSAVDKAVAAANQGEVGQEDGLDNQVEHSHRVQP